MIGICTIEVFLMFQQHALCACIASEITNITRYFSALLLQVERSGCGSGSCGFLALLHQKEFIKINQLKTFVNGKTQSQLIGRVIKQVSLGDIPAVVAEVSGKAFYTGERTFYHEVDDPLPFLQIK